MGIGNDLELTLKLKGDEDGLVGSVRVSKEEVKTFTNVLDKNEKQTKETGNSTKQLGSRHKELAQPVRVSEKQVEKLTDELDKNEKQTKKTSRGIGGLLKSLKGVAGPIAALGIGATLTTMVKQTLTAGDQLHKLNLRIGASVEAMSEYKHVTQLSGVEFNTLATGWQRSSRRIAEAAQGTGEAKDALLELGLEAKALNELRPEEQFEAIADAMAGVEDQGDKVRLSMKLFDTEGVALLQTMEGGSKAIREMRQEARDLGLTMSQETAEEIAATNDEMTKLAARSDASAQRMTVALLPAIQAVTGALITGADAVSNFFNKLSGKSQNDEAIEQFATRTDTQLKSLISRTKERIAEYEKVQPKEGFWGSLTDGAHDTAQREIQGLTQDLDNMQSALARVTGKSKAGSPKTPGVFIPPSKPSQNKAGASARSDALKKEQKEAEELRAIYDRLFPDEAKQRAYLEELAKLEAGHAKGTLSAEKLASSQAALANEFNDTKGKAEGLQRIMDRLYPEKAERRDFNKALAELDQALADGTLTALQHAEATALMNKQWRDAHTEVTQLSNETTEFMRGVERINGTAVQGLEDAWAGFFTGQKVEWENLALHIIDQMARTQFQQSVGNNLFSMLNTGVEMIVGRGQAASQFNIPAGNQQAGMIAEQMIDMHHDGGLAGKSPLGRRVPNSLFKGAPKYHTGGIAGDEIPAILKRGEEVLTRNDPRHINNGGGQSSSNHTTVINIGNNANAQTVAEARRFKNQIDAQAVGAVKKEMSRGGL